MPIHKQNLVHVVKRYGPVGGMERYVWELVNELEKLGYSQTVICEHCHTNRPHGVEVIELGQTAKRPRWLSQVRFSARVTRWVKNHPDESRLIHSNERIGVHDITTFHGPPFATIYDQPWWKFISLRVWVRLHLERRELKTAKIIVPNSALIRQQLAHYYPEFAKKLSSPVVPGVLPIQKRESRQVPSDGGRVCFVGWEWQRKGLPMALKIIERLRLTRPNLELWVVGPRPEEIQPLFTKWHGGYRLLGWCDDSKYLSNVDVLLHPAKAEPYGMVISEAMTASVPVVISDRCGAAAEVGPESGAVLALEAPLTEWVVAVEQQLQRKDAPPSYTRSWGAVATDYEKIYTALRKGADV